MVLIYKPEFIPKRKMLSPTKRKNTFEWNILNCVNSNKYREKIDN